MKPDQFSRDLADFRVRLADSGAGDPEAAVEALGVTMEELRVAEEELHRQNDELILSRDAVERERRRYRLLFELAPDAYLVTDSRGLIREANEAATRLLGVEPRFIAGKPLANFVAPGGRSNFRAEVSRLREAGGARRYELSLQPRGGVAFPASTTVAPLHDPAGAPAALLWTIRDVSREKLAEARLLGLNSALELGVLDRSRHLEAEYREKERVLLGAHAQAAWADDANLARFRDLIRGLDAVVWQADVATGRILFVNDRAEALLGYPASSWLEEPDAWAARLHPEDRDYAAAQRDRAAREGVDSEAEYRMVAADGRAVWFRVGLRVVRDGSGRPAELHALMVNITKRKKVERQLYTAKTDLTARLDDMTYLNELQGRLTATLELQPVFGEVLAAVASLQGADMAAIRLLDRDRGELTPGASLGLDSADPRLLGPIRKGVGSCGVVWAADERVIVEDVAADPRVASFRDVYLASGVRATFSTPLRDSDGTLLGTIATFFRMPHRPSGRQVHLVEMYARHASQFLALARIFREVREADRRKDEFLATLSHELRNPLASLRAAAHLLQRADSDPAAAESARAVVDRQVAQMTRLVDDLLDVSRIGRGQLVLVRGAVDLARVAVDALAVARPLIEARGHAVTLELADVPLWVEVDAGRLEQVVVNLLNNAAKYTDPGGRIDVSAGRAGDEVVVRVRDTGIGISAEVLSYVFDLFHQVDPASPRGQGGLGIGLSLVRALVERQGGTVEARSAGLGRGSEFLVAFPALAAPPGPGQDGPRARRPEALESPRAPKRLMIVDDHADTATLLARILRADGHTVEISGDGPEALRAADSFRPDLVLLDLSLPGMDGFAVAAGLREALGPVPIFALSGYGGPEDIRRTHDAGFAHHLIKPIDPDVLRVRIAEELFSGETT